MKTPWHRTHPIASTALLTPFAFAAVFLAAGSSPAQESGPGEDISSQAEMIFVGTVGETGVAADADVQAGPDTVVVRVEEILRPEAGALTGFVGRDVTVRLATAGSPAAGSRATFYTRLWMLGRGLALIELGHVAADAGVDAAMSSAQGVMTAQDDSKLVARMARADFVVMGRVTAVREVAAAAADSPGIQSEHAPEWHEAEITVEEGIKGAGAGQSITVRFCASEDVAWVDAPKFTVGQEGVFILEEGEVRGVRTTAPTPDAAEYDGTIVDPGNVLAKDQAERVKRLLGQQ